MNPSRSRQLRWTALGLSITALALAVSAPARAVDLQPATQPAKPARPGDDAYDWDHWRQFWSFKPVRRPELPAVKDATWATNPIDRFVLAKLEEKDLRPAPEADKATLIRRVTYDLTGLPPTPQEVRAFVTDTSPDAYEKVVDRLLASPHYGEKWGRHWLDVARYVQGRITFPGVKHTSGDQAYRDYVVRAFNKDKPYDRFVTEQLAGDLLPPEKDPEAEFDRITAPAFLSIGAWFDMCTDPNRLKLEMVDEMVSTTSKAFLGLSVGCARCHDHKFDPIPTADYYALGGIFRSTRLVGEFSEYWREGRVRQLRPLAMPDEVAANDRLRDKIKEKKAALWQYLSDRHAERMGEWKAQEAAYRSAAGKIAKPFTVLFEAENFDSITNLHIAQLQKDGKGIDVIESLNPTAQSAVYRVEPPEPGEYRLEAFYCTDDKVPVQVVVNGTTQVAATLNQPTGGWDLKYLRWGDCGTLKLHEGLNFVRLGAKDGDFPRVDRFRLYRVDQGFDERVKSAAQEANLDPLLLAHFVVDPDRPWPSPGEMAAYLPDERVKPARDLLAAIGALEAEIKPYELVVAVTDQGKCEDLPIHIKGGTYQVSKDVPPRGSLRLFENVLPLPKVPENHSGRLELAGWLTDPRNPLTARVMVNRLWHYHFGRGIVATPSDFGSRGQAPTHPELLDWLASTFVEQGWSMKKMHRLILLSSTYRMSSRPDPRVEKVAAQTDPDNRWLSHFPRRRLEAEEIYDAMVSTTNRIVRQEPGKPLDVDKSKNRAMYVLSANRSPKGLGNEVRKMFPLFDYDPSGAPIDVRPSSTTPAQSLFWLNNPLPKYFADLFAERLLKMDSLTDPKRIDMAYMLAVGHSPSKEMKEQALGYVQQLMAEGATKQEAWTQFCLALYAATEFRYVE